MLSACGTAADSGRAQSSDAAPGAADSVKAVAAAMSAIQAQTPSAKLEVHEFRREADGYVVTLRSRGRVLGGGGVVRVFADGATRIETRYQ